MVRIGGPRAVIKIITHLDRDGLRSATWFRLAVLGEGDLLHLVLLYELMFIILV